MNNINSNPFEVFTEAINRGILLNLEQIKNYCEFLSDDFIKWHKSLVDFFILDQFVSDDSINEFIFQETNNVLVDRNGKVSNEKITEDIDTNIKEMLIKTITLSSQEDLNYNTPFKSFYKKIRSKNFRITIVHNSLSPISQSKIFFRRIRENYFSIDNFCENQDIKELLTSIIINKKNILLAGATGSGKTSLMNSFLNIIPSSEHVIILEDTHELMSYRNNFTYMISDNLNPNKNLTNYCHHALRMRPDRIILGELRGAETIPYILTMNNGHKGLLSTIHANNAQDALSRLALLFSLYSNKESISLETIFKLICQNIQYVIYIENKKIKEIISVIGSEKMVSYIEKIYSTDQLKL